MEEIYKIRADLWVFDSDGTLYTNTAGIQHAIEKLMIEFVCRFYGVCYRDAELLRKALLEKHKTKYTALALRQEGIDISQFIRETYLAVSPEDYGINSSGTLLHTLSKLGGEKQVLTNNPSGFARLILRALGIEHLFSGIVGMEELGFVLKPSPQAFSRLKLPLDRGMFVVVVDDSPENLHVAHSMGCYTVLVGEKHIKDEITDLHIKSLIEGV